MSSKHNFTAVNTKLQLQGLFACFRKTRSKPKACTTRKAAERVAPEAPRSLCQLTYRFALKSLAAAQRLALFGATVWLHPAHKIWVLKLGVYQKCWIQRFV